MKPRLLLTVGSALAVLVISTIATHLVLWELKPGRIEEVSLWRIHALTVLPATSAAAVAAAWCSGRRYWTRLDAMGQTLPIFLNSYVLYGLFVVAFLSVEQILHGGYSDFGILESIGLTFVLGGLITFAAMVVTALPVLIAEYLIVRFVRSRLQSALSSEVAP